LAAVQGSTFVNPFLSAPGVEGLAGRSVIYKVDSRITAGGVLLDGSHAILGESLFIGYSIPLMRVRATHQYVLNQGSNDPLDTTDPLVKMLLPGEVNQVERVRQSVHTALGLEAQDWETGGFGDIDVHLRWQCHWDHVLLTRSIYSNFIAGVVFPTGVQIAKNNAVTVPFMGDGHWSLYLDGLHEVELKHDWKVGLLSSYMLQLSSTRERRLPVFKEPAPFSALIAKTEVDPGFTFKISPYITIENIIDGMHIQARYTYIQHSDDKWTDKRSDKTILSYLVNQAATGRTLTDVAQNIQTKKHNTSWRAQYFTFGLSYDTTASLKKWSLSPVFYINFDTPLANKGVAKTNQLTLGVELHF